MADGRGDFPVDIYKLEVGEGLVFAYGNPLLDVQADVDEAFLTKYGLEPNNAILADDRHKDLYDELADQYTCEYIAGGATLNACRVAQWILKKPFVCSFTGCITDDRFGKALAESAAQNGVRTVFQYTDQQPTGTCAVLVTSNGQKRSLVANLAAANCFTIDHLDKSEVNSLINNANFYYTAGYPLTVCPKAMLKLGQLAAEKNKVMGLNLSAPFLCQFFKEPMLELLPYVDFLFGNESEAEEFSKQNDLKTTDIKVIAQQVAKWRKVNSSRPRIVVFTQGGNSTIVSDGETVQEFPVISIQPENIVDTNGAGDAFVGGFLAQLSRGGSTEECIRCAHYAAHYIIQQSGVTLNDPSDYK